MNYPKENLKIFLEASKRIPLDLGLFLETEQNLINAGEEAIPAILNFLRKNDESQLTQERVIGVLIGIGKPAKEYIEHFMSEIGDKKSKTREALGRAFMRIC